MPSKDKLIFYPYLLDTLKSYTGHQFYKDVIAGIIVGIVALPLAIAFGIASGVSPQVGVVTAIVGGFIVSLLGGSKVQIGGPTGAFIIIVYGIVQKYGLDGLIISTFLAGVMLLLMGVARFGSVIKFIPFPVIVGFTSGIAVIIFSSQLKDLLGLPLGDLPAGFAGKWAIYFKSWSQLNLYSLAIGSITIVIISFWSKLTHKVPGSLVAIVATTLLVHLVDIPVETVESRFGNISGGTFNLKLPNLDPDTIGKLFAPAFTIALLGAIESLLSAVVADGMTGGSHRSNTELIAQGIANIGSSVLGGIPVTGAIARTATNIKNGGRTPIAGIIHALSLLLMLLFVGKWVILIPMATLAGILVVVAYHMSEWENFLTVLKGPTSDIIVLLTTFILTVAIDLTVAIEVGMVLAAFLFMQKMIKVSKVRLLEGDDRDTAIEISYKSEIDKKMQIFELHGPLFFGAAYKFKDAMKLVAVPPKVLILRLRDVPIIDVTGIQAIQELNRTSKERGTKLILTEISSEQVMKELRKSRVVFQVGKANIVDNFQNAVKRAHIIIEEYHI